MKYEETSDITTILMEPADEALFVLNWIGERCHPARPIVFILPVNASVLFGQFAVLSMLRQLQDERAGTILLVIPGNASNERLRSWVAQQGFPVFATVETCTRTLAQRSPSSVQQHALRGVLSPTRRAQRSPVESDRTTTTALAVPNPVLRTTDEFPLRPARRMDSRELHTGEIRRETGPLILRDGPTAVRMEQRNRQDIFMLILVALLILGILGGLGFGYLLTFTNGIQQTVSPGALLPVQLFQ
jgi:hypothetical protein